MKYVSFSHLNLLLLKLWFNRLGKLSRFQFQSYGKCKSMPKTQLLITFLSFCLRRWPSSDRPCHVRLAKSSEFQNPSEEKYICRSPKTKEKKNRNNLAQTPNIEERNKTKSSWLLFTNLQNLKNLMHL